MTSLLFLLIIRTSLLFEGDAILAYILILVKKNPPLGGFLA
jgi:hypothetical protein